MAGGVYAGPTEEHEVSVNSTRVTGVLGINVWDLTYAEWQSRRQMRQIAAFLRAGHGFDLARRFVQAGPGEAVDE